jgi:hypothetical protein
VLSLAMIAALVALVLMVRSPRTEGL